ncbi:MAG: hypothetical protein H7336_04550 [Bacteriovorax sp.]|nr:hypothetical protein [Bacteriovorax sp.]
MKTLCVVLFAVFLAIAVAEDSSLTISPGIETRPAPKLEQQRETKSTKAYKLAKEACVKSSDGKLKGKKLTECIVNYQREAK